MSSNNENKITLKSIYGLVGEQKIIDLVTTFYTFVWDDDECPEFSNLFRESSEKDLSILSLTRYFVQKFGGPKFYGGMRMETHHMKDIHSQFPITKEGAERWLYHFDRAVNETDFGEHHDEIIQVMNKWLNLFAKSVINKFN
eukprot:TRINITY_DN5679_c0_g1_i1.p1 TRINITY_DN5679_c0_g1~~TRINITY_DN5679_c0_g1_i1.p1  ORF type:complete len:165 (-),score=1.69 TRINITY_DN5679_c0_g1_i1:80-505(-)